MSGMMTRTAGILGVTGTLVLSGLGVSLMAADTTPRLFFLDIRGGRVLSTRPDGSDLQVLVDNKKESPDGIAVDVDKGFIYWSNMGKAAEDDGSVFRTNLDGSHFTTLVPKGGTFTAKQMKLDEKHGKMYWSDREGMRIQRANLDGSNVETLVVTGKGDKDRADAANWCVGIALDIEGGKVYWTQKGGDNAFKGTIRRASLEIPKGQTAENRNDVEILFDALPEPIDLDLDVKNRMIYWTDRGDAPRGNTVNRAPMKVPAVGEDCWLALKVRFPAVVVHIAPLLKAMFLAVATLMLSSSLCWIEVRTVTMPAVVTRKAGAAGTLIDPVVVWTNSSRSRVRVERIWARRATVARRAAMGRRRVIGLQRERS
mgnify:CR=1 FL=1